VTVACFIARFTETPRHRDVTDLFGHVWPERRGIVE
jgi:hypothetical protein